jgi:hypothetical protein
VSASEAAIENPRITIPVQTCVANFALIESKWAGYQEQFKEHNVLELYYEDVCANLLAARSRMLAFLGLPEEGSVKVHSQKTGTDSLRDAIENYEELKAAMPNRTEFFDD